MTGAETFRCARHPDVETNLRCGKCGTPICPKCMVQTPVGARCPDCARVKKIPVYDVPPLYYLRAIGAGFGAGIGTGLVWGLIHINLPTFFFNILLAAGAGLLIGEIITRSVNRKKGTGLAIIGGLCVLLACGIAYAVEINRFGFPGINLLRMGYEFLSAAVGVFLAVNRLR